MKRRKILWLVPARGGSKGIPGKNLRHVGGLPIVARAVRGCIRAATLVTTHEHEVVCSTDSPEIASVARRWGAKVPFMRPAELSSDEADSTGVALHAIDWHVAHHGAPPDVVGLVQPTSPLTQAEDLATALLVHEGNPDDSVVTVMPAAHSAWSYRVEDGRLVPLSSSAEAGRRQDAGNIVGLNGAAFLATPGFLREHRRFLVPGRTRPSHMAAAASIDIDSEDQLLACESLLRARPIRSFSIGARPIGPEAPCYVIAEAGVNHNGDVALAHRLVDVAADAGADAVKFQTFNPSLLAAVNAPKAEYQKRTTGGEESHQSMLEALVLSHSAHRELRAHAAERGIEFLSSPFDEESADFLMELGLPAFKIPSGEITNLPLLRHIARFGRPLLVSTGMCEMVEVAEALDAIRAEGDPPVGLFHCVSNYPAEPRTSNLRAMEALTLAFSRPVGWSDHTLGIDISLAASALGARLLEKHVTLSRSMTGPDHSASLEPAELAALVRGVRAIESSLGDGIKMPREEEIPMRRIARKSLHWKKALPSGHKISEADLICLRPGDGLPPASRESLLQHSLRREVKEGAMVTDDDVTREGGQ